jgi:hypothetical protein
MQNISDEVCLTILCGEGQCEQKVAKNLENCTSTSIVRREMNKIRELQQKIITLSFDKEHNTTINQ